MFKCLKMDDTILIKIKNTIYEIKEGTGDNLSVEDSEAGYIDYIYYDVYKDIESLKEDCPIDGGLVLLRKRYSELTDEEIILNVIARDLAIDLDKEMSPWDKEDDIDYQEEIYKDIVNGKINELKEELGESYKAVFEQYSL